HVSLVAAKAVGPNPEDSVGVESRSRLDIAFGKTFVLFRKAEDLVKIDQFGARLLVVGRVKTQEIILVRGTHEMLFIERNGRRTILCARVLLDGSEREASGILRDTGSRTRRW